MGLGHGSVALIQVHNVMTNVPKMNKNGNKHLKRATQRFF